ncbi:hypothetical protein [Candidatus Electronema sp. JM]|uniref:hypothetical protein n=1 Tax=Candidatus Electronema sp. JM TaxID=3401571 RepID=UPI003AA97853
MSMKNDELYARPGHHATAGTAFFGGRPNQLNSSARFCDNKQLSFVINVLHLPPKKELPPERRGKG